MSKLLQTLQGTSPSGWIFRKVTSNDKWVRRWLEVHRHILCSYQACPLEANVARIINMLDIRKTKEIKLVDEGASGLFCIVPVSTDGNHPGYLMRADTQAQAQEWVHGLNRVREQQEIRPSVPPIPVAAAAIIQNCAYIDAPIADAADASANEIVTPALFATALSDDASTLPPPPPASTVPTAATLGDAKTTFTQLKEDLDLDDDVRAISVDYDFMVTLQCLFNMNFTDISPDAENICRNLIDAKGKGSIKYIHWKLFYDTWSRSGLSMPEYLQSNDTKLLIG
uniref:PH domain-containing protein n=1 Tax=Aureoumbra lagunensis TaxID=44058 RepID=A0A7S3NNW1_9STRA